ncbi:hypothetical protein [Croceimicrobium sp.]|uniref:hypothetical protein n=1 Tax=Croceimicrobium sp. TaxID=2828340 RepID=UPI003BAC1FF2
MTKGAIENLIATNVANESNVTASELREVLSALLSNDYYETTLSDTDQAPEGLGGWTKGFTVADIKNKGIVEIFDKLFFQGLQRVVIEDVAVVEGPELTVLTDISDVAILRCQVIGPDGTDYAVRYRATMSKSESTFNLPSNFPSGTYRVIAYR